MTETSKSPDIHVEKILALTSFEVAAALAPLLESGDVAVVEKFEKKMKRIRVFLLDRYKYVDLQKSAYWHAFSSSTTEEDLTIYENEYTVKQIALTISDMVSKEIKPLLELEEQEYSSAFLDNIERFRSEIAENASLSVFFQEQLQRAVAEVRAEFPEYQASKIPELDRAIGGSETRFPDIPKDKVGEILTSFASKYRRIREDFIVKLAIVKPGS